MSTPEFHIRTNGLYWRPEAKGYTSDVRDAGRWSHDEAHKLIEGLGPEKHAGIVLAQPRAIDREAAETLVNEFLAERQP